MPTLNKQVGTNAFFYVMIHKLQRQAKSISMYNNSPSSIRDYQYEAYKYLNAQKISWRRHVKSANYMISYHQEHSQWDSDRLTLHELAQFVFQKNKQLVKQHNQLLEKSHALAARTLQRAKLLHLDYEPLCVSQPNAPLAIDHHCLERIFFKKEDPTFEQKEWMYDVHDENKALYCIILELRRSNAAAEKIIEVFQLYEKSREPRVQELEVAIKEVEQSISALKDKNRQLKEKRQREG